MIILKARPPLFDDIDAKFNVRGKPILFAWGSIIYIPSGSAEVPPHLMAHEKAHGTRQLTFEAASIPTAPERIVAWWRRYLADDKFRLDEEIFAHKAEYNSLCRHGGGRQDRRRHLAVTAGKLAAPLYGRLISLKDAKAVLSGEENAGCAQAI